MRNVTTIQANIEVTPAIEEHVQVSAETLQKYSNNSVLHVDVHLKKEHKTKFTAVVVGEGKSCTASSDNMYIAITKAFEKMEAIMSKEKSVKLHKRNHPVQLDISEDTE